MCCKILKKTIILFFLFDISIFAQQNVLVLNSYNHGFTWTDQITKAIRDILVENTHANIYIEYMDILNISENEPKSKGIKEKEFLVILLTKYKDTKFDVVITVDYTAFSFARRHGNYIWDGVPIVACGINQQQAASVDSANSLWSGVYEFYDVSAQVDFIQRLQNNVERIIFITDNSEAGHNIREQLNTVPSINQKNINLEEWKEPHWESLPKFLLYLNPRRDAVVIAGSNLNSSIRNSQKQWQTVTKYIDEHSMAPVYSFWDVGVQNGVIGGHVVFAPSMGKSTGLLAAAILTANGNYRPGFERSINLPMMDDKAAMNRNLLFDKIPLETIRLNKIDSWLDKYQRYMSNMKNAILAELVIILILGFSFYGYFKYSNRKLLREKVAVEKASKAKSLFLANMSHEIRTPLNSMLGFSELLMGRSKNLNDEQREWCKNIEISSYHMRNTFNNILDYSKIEAGTLVIENGWVDVFALCDDLISVCKHNLSYKSVRFYVMPSIAMPRFIRTDHVKLKQVLVNLISNAIKFTNKGSARLMVNYKDGKVCFEIVDTGIGIPKEKLEKVFDAYEQVDVARARQYGGAGLGLTISQNILKAMGSGIEVESDQTGSRFYFNIAVKTKEEAFFKRFLSKADQNVSLYHKDVNALKYMEECVEMVKGNAIRSTNIDNLLDLKKQDLLIAQADNLTNFQIQKISTRYPRVILLFYKENNNISQIKNEFPKFECILSPIKSADAVNAFRRLYAD